MGDIRELLAEQAGRWFLWTTLGLGIGAALYFTLPMELGRVLILGLFAVSGLGFFWARNWWIMPVVLVSSIAAGLASGGLRAQLVASPKLAEPVSGVVTGTVLRIDQSVSGAPRLWLRDVVIPGHTAPDRVRITLSKDADHALHIGDTLRIEAFLAPPPRKSDPHGYDFERAAWFLRLGAVGYARDPPLSISPREGRSILVAVREWVSMTLASNLSPRAFSFAKAILLGDRSSISEEDIEALRISNLAHLLAISGLHMGLMTAIAFAVVRIPLALAFPSFDGRVVKKTAALAALTAAFAYLSISGFGVATQRAFVMVAVMLFAILLDRPAISLRSLALAGFILLVFRPELIIHAGFQMSFAATSALIIGFDATKHWMAEVHFRWSKGVLSVTLSSFIAGLATAPVALAHFNRIAVYGLPANLISVPLMGFAILPTLLAGLALTPIGLGAPFFFCAEHALLWILYVAETTAAQPAAAVPVQSFGMLPLSFLGLGWAIFCIGAGPLRWAGLIPLCAALVMSSFVTRPDLLISERSGAVGILVNGARAVNLERSASFEINQWLENDGSSADQASAFSAWPNTSIAQPTRDIIVYAARKRPADWIPCEQGTLVVLPRINLSLRGECAQIRQKDLKDGALMVYRKGDGFEIKTIPQQNRLWSRKADQ